MRGGRREWSNCEVGAFLASHNAINGDPVRHYTWIPRSICELIML